MIRFGRDPVAEAEGRELRRTLLTIAQRVDKLLSTAEAMLLVRGLPAFGSRGGGGVRELLAGLASAMGGGARDAAGEGGSD